MISFQMVFQYRQRSANPSPSQGDNNTKRCQDTILCKTMTYFDLKGYCFLNSPPMFKIKLHLRQMGSYITRFLTFRFLLELVFLVGSYSIEENLLFHYISVEVLATECEVALHLEPNICSLCPSSILSSVKRNIPLHVRLRRTFCKGHKKPSR